MVSMCGLRAVLVAGVLSSSLAFADDLQKTTIYLTRHENDMNTLVAAGAGKFQDKCTTDRVCCEQILNPLGQERALRLADWFASNHITERVDTVIATFKPRTGASVQGIATAAGKPIVTIPANMIECDNPSASYDATVSMQPMADYLHALPLGTTAVVATHSTTLYQILHTFGINVLTVTPSFFPLDRPAGATTCDPQGVAKTGDVNHRGCKVLGFSNLWKLVIDKHGNATVTDHWILDTELQSSVHDRSGRDGNGDGN